MGHLGSFVRHLGLLREALGRDLLNSCFPQLCPLCGVDSSGRCSAGGCAQHELPSPGAGLPGARCDRCAGELPPMLPDGTRCASCRRRPPRATQVVALGDYRADAALREWILALKHRGRADLALPLGRALAACLTERLGGEQSSALLVPVPLHPLRRLQRGYDQARCLARAAAEALDATWQPLLVRRRWTPPQGSAWAPARATNVHAAFGVPARRALDLRGLQLWLVDDVLTSGATVESCARVLAGMGARRIGVLCVARAGESKNFG